MEDAVEPLGECFGECCCCCDARDAVDATEERRFSSGMAVTSTITSDPRGESPGERGDRGDTMVGDRGDMRIGERGEPEERGLLPDRSRREPEDRAKLRLLRLTMGDFPVSKAAARSEALASFLGIFFVAGRGGGGAEAFRKSAVGGFSEDEDKAAAVGAGRFSFSLATRSLNFCGPSFSRIPSMAVPDMPCLFIVSIDAPRATSSAAHSTWRPVRARCSADSPRWSTAVSCSMSP